jgi:hypothetical protein
MRSLLKRDGGAFALFLALTCALTNPLVFHLARAVEDKQDALLNTWIIAWVGHALVTDPLHLFDTNIFYPYTNTLAFSETLLPQGLLALPINLAFDNTVLGYNLVLLVAFFLAAYAMYLFVLDLTHTRGAGMIAGTIFAFNPYNLGNLAQVQLLSFGWLPLALLFLWRLLGDSRFEIRKPFLFALFFSLQALSSVYYAFLAGLTVALSVVWFLATEWFESRKLHLQSPIPNLFPRVPTQLALAAILIVILVTPILLPYLSVQRDLGFQRKIEDSEPFSASLGLYTEVSPQNVLYGNLLAPRPPIIVGGYPLDNLFPGLGAFALAIVGIVAAKNRERWFYALLLALAFLFSLGPRLFITPSLGTSITLPYRWLYDVVPLIHALRAPVRFDALVIFALAVLAGWGACRLEIGNWRLAIVIFLVALEYLAIPAATITPVPTGDAVPQFARWLARRPRATILELPMLASDPTAPLDLTPQYLSTYHWQRTPDGYSGFVPPKHGEIAYTMKFFPNERAISLLQALDVEYVIVHANQFADWAAQRETIGREPHLRLVTQMANDFVYRVAPRAQDASALTARLYLPNPLAPSQNYFAYVIAQNRAPRSFAIKPTENLQVDWKTIPSPLQGEGLGAGRSNAPLPLVTSTASVIPVRLTAPARAGDYKLELHIASAALGEWKLSGELHVRNEEPARQVVIPARVELSTPLKAQYAAGETIQVDLTWLPLNKIDAYYSASVRVVDTHGTKIIAQDRQPATLTLLWTPGVAVSDRFALTLPRDLAPGEYSVQVLMYQADQGVDALLLDEQFAPREESALGTFTVK